MLELNKNLTFVIVILRKSVMMKDKKTSVNYLMKIIKESVK
jgi:hypothetical protein